MKHWLLLVFLGLSLAGRAQDAWPRNAAGKVEFTGTLPWPPEVQTEAQRQELVRHWYETKLTDRKLAELKAYSDRYVAPTYNHLPGEAMMDYYRRDYYEREYGFVLRYEVRLNPTAEGLVCNFSKFITSRLDDDVITTGIPVEEVLDCDRFKKQSLPVAYLAFNNFRKRFASALASW